MLKLIIAFERQPNMSRAQCHDHLRNAHAPLVGSVEEFMRYLRGYTQNFTEGEARFGAPDFNADAVAQLWFDDIHGFSKAFSEPRYLELIRPDEMRFADPNRLIITCAEEALHWDVGDAGDVKCFRFLTPRKGAGNEQARSWKQEYPELILKTPSLRRMIGKYVQNWSLADADQAFAGAQGVLGVEELWFSPGADPAAFLALEQDALKQQAISALDVDVDDSVVVVARERVVFPVTI